MYGRPVHARERLAAPPQRWIDQDPANRQGWRKQAKRPAGCQSPAVANFELDDTRLPAFGHRIRTTTGREPGLSHGSLTEVQAWPREATLQPTPDRHPATTTPGARQRAARTTKSSGVFSGTSPR